MPQPPVRSSTRPTCEDLRDDIHHDAMLDNYAGRKFVSAIQLKHFLTQKRIEGVLRCTCTNCAALRSSVVARNLKGVVQWIVISALRTFALLVYSGCAQLIYGFSTENWDDQRLVQQKLQTLSSDNVGRICWPLLVNTDPRWSKRLADEVANRRYQFFVPTLHDRIASPDELQSYPEDAILPFISQSVRGSGSFGRVYNIEIHEEYKEFQDLNATVPLVRKEIDPASQPEQYEELAILLYVRNLNDDHVVRLITAYKHGSRINYIFPKALTNLHDLMRRSSDHVGISCLKIQHDPLWDETLAILRVLQRIHNDVYQTTSGKHVKLYHFDLKPANILVDMVDGKPKLLLADFGLSRSRIAATQAETSRIVGHGGTPAYAPPEIDASDRQRNHRYDIWSIGCILLEICAFVIDGTKGVQRLDNERFTPEVARNNNWDDYFWHCTSDGKLEVKPSVDKWLSHMQAIKTNGDAAEFVRDVIQLAREMLQVDVTLRLDAETAQSKLSEIILDARARIIDDSSFEDTVSLDEDQLDVVPVGSDRLENIARVNCKYWNKYFDDIRPRLYENVSGSLSLQLWKQSVLQKEIELGDRRSISVVPSPAVIPSTAITRPNTIKVLIKSIQEGGRDIVTFYVHNPVSAAILQSVLMGQAARGYNTDGQRSLALKSLQMSQWMSRLDRIKKKKPINIVDWGRPIAIQLWSEQSFKDATAVARVRPRRPSPRFHFEAPARRLVIFCEKALVIVRFAKNARLEKPHEKYTGNRHKIIATDHRASSHDPSFEVSVLASLGNAAYSIPLELSYFADLEERNSFECTSLAFEFENRDDWTDFWRKYRLLKKEWSEEYDCIEREKVRGAQERGWAPA